MVAQPQKKNTDFGCGFLLGCFLSLLFSLLVSSVLLLVVDIVVLASVQHLLLSLASTMTIAIRGRRPQLNVLEEKRGVGEGEAPYPRKET